MIDATLAEQLAAEVADAERTKVPAPQISRRHPDLTIEDAYAIQAAGVRLAADSGRVIKGRKIGLTSTVMQQALGIDEPDYGVIYDDMFHDDGSTVPMGLFIAPRIEVELAFVLGAELSGPDCTLYDVLRATEVVTPAIEILDARIQMTDPDTGGSRTIIDTISDNAADAGIVCGGRPVRPFDVDLRRVAAVVYRNAAVEDTGVAAAVLNHPAHGVAWLANRLFPHGVTLEEGLVILSGSFIKPIWVRSGDTFHADFGSLGTVSVQFVPDSA